MKMLKTPLLMSLCLMPFVVPLTSCKEKGPAEKAGEKLDNAAEKVGDALDPKGPAEKAGEKIDDALDH
ncbi:hypothetical protein JIN85_00525 [Luteolibacter pohnpeiensis]|uniref:Cathelicidin antimicrobial peptide C-terminal domain-containing protein n=1 Tax=Luteolibacter pohnpeiensis TaxID=454153 RepID=A0A934S4B6_9BACT|nr:hypothetical protein [Luteolibacter pohnpeiensis]MBK1880874.1 hypothetical protein [Luteolibacter pohnpeiensis]